MTDVDEKPQPPAPAPAHAPQEGSDNDDDDEIPRHYDDEDDDDDDDPFGAYGGPGGPPHGIASSLRALGMISGIHGRMRDLLSQLKQKEDPSVQLIALQELAEILLMAQEDTLTGQFSPDAFVKELIVLMQPSEYGEENPEMMLLACRCIANMMESMPQSVANIVYGGAVPVLCQKLLEINFIDLAEQALSVRPFSPAQASSTKYTRH